MNPRPPSNRPPGTATDEHPELPFDPDTTDPAPAGRSAGGPAVHTRPLALALVAVGGMAGATVRALTATHLAVPAGHWPNATFAVNIIGAFILGALLETLADERLNQQLALRLRLLAGTGFCGALTTYSTLAVEVDLLTRGHHLVLAGAYAAASVSVGLLATATGIWAATTARRRG